MNNSSGRVTSQIAERRAKGAEWRRQVPLAAHAEWKPPANRADPVEVLIEQGKSRIQELLPVRYARMKTDPFAFLRGAAAIMAADLASCPATGLRVQACGDCHLSNFGGYASPESTPVFDVNDFDETLPAPFEWDVKRLAASLAVAGRVAKLPGRECRRLARAATKSYRRRLGELALLSPLDAWSSRIDLAATIAAVDSNKIRHQIERRREAVLQGAREHYGLVEKKNGDWRIKDRPPLVRHLHHHELHAHEAFASYAESLQEDRRVLVQASVLAPFAGASEYANHGERVVVGQRMMQATPDVFLGWTQNLVNGRYFYVRRLKDSRLANIGAILEEALPYYAKLCGHTLARAHARAGDAIALSGYMGDDSEFDKAIAEFAMAYADQTEHDWHALLDAIKAGRISTGEA